MTMLRYNQGKLPLSLIPTSFFEAIFNAAYEIGTTVPVTLIREVGAVLDFGAKKYSEHNWRKGGSWASVLNSGLRHLLAMIEGQELDDESGLPHSGHLGCNIAFLLEFALTASGNDDRYRVVWTHGFNGEPVPNLVWVLDALLKFRDGGSVDCLVEAAWELARYVEFQKDAAGSEPESGSPAEMGIWEEPSFPDEPRPFSLPFRFPSFGFVNLDNVVKH